MVEVKDPRTAFARVYGQWFDQRVPGVHETATVDPGVVMGERCSIGPRVVIHAGTTLGDRVKVQAGAVLGSDGFGYARVREGYIGFPQIGTLWIGDDVEIGANTTIDRGALGETRIGRGTKIDNLVHIAHNCVVGEDVIIAAQVGMAGSCVIEDGAMLGGQVGLGERVTIGKGVILGGQGGVLPGKLIDGRGCGVLGHSGAASAGVSTGVGADEEGLMAVVVVGGHTRNIGKTSVVAGLIAALPEMRWTAMKITQFGHGVCSANGEACDCETADHTIAVSEERVANGTDSGRYLGAGAVRSLWVRTRHGSAGRGDAAGAARDWGGGEHHH